MPSIDVVIESPVSNSPRCRQLEALFDVPPVKVERLSWSGDLPLDDKPWQVGAIIGPSGCGKSTIARHLWADRMNDPEWSASAVVDDFDKSLTMAEITDVCQAVGFNTIPAWRRPYGVLSGGEKFRVMLARKMLEADGLCVVDEFTSVVDRQVAKIGSHAVQKFIRKDANRKFVAVSCHDDVLEWLRPDWVLRPADMTFEWTHGRWLRRPSLEVTISPAPYAAWRTFAPYHYLSADLNKAARCYVLYVGEKPAAFVGVMHRPHARNPRIKGVSRLVTLPDWQGLGLAFVLTDTVAACYKALGWEFRMYPAHPALIRSYDRSPVWALRKKPGFSSLSTTKKGGGGSLSFGGRPCAVFSYEGPPHPDQKQAELLIGASVRI